MKVQLRLIGFLVALVSCGGALLSCGGGASSDRGSRLSIFPAVTTVAQGATQQFTATANTQVSWTIQEGSAGGSIDSAGLYTAPNSPGAFHVIATSLSDASKVATAMVTVLPVTVFLNPHTMSMTTDETVSFTAFVRGTINSGVSWSIQEGASGGTITSNGAYTSPAVFGTFHVVVTSQADPSKTDMATVTVAAVSVTISPAQDVLGPAGVRPFSAFVTGPANRRVTWTVEEGPAGGSISADGSYTAPSSGMGTFHAVATSTQDPSKSATATVKVIASGFRPTASMGRGRTAHTATLLPDGKVLVAGGNSCFFDYYYYYYSITSCTLSSAELYDLSTGTFSDTGKMSVTRVSHTATLLANGKVLVAGGSTARAELYDPTAEKFTATGGMSVGRDSHTATLLQDGRVLVTGGHNPTGALASAEIYDPSSGAFTPTGSMTTARMSHTATLLANGNVLIAGGLNSSGALSTAELYDPATGSFTSTGDMTSQRGLHAAASFGGNNKVLLTGGSASSKSLDTAEVYDVSTGRFTATGMMASGRDSHFAVALPNGSVLVGGGSGFTAEVYDPTTQTFTPTGSLEVRRVLPAAALLQDGRVLVCGGSDWSSAELFK